MGKGDKKSKRGKIFAGSYGKARPKPNKLKKHKGPPEGKDDGTGKAKPAAAKPAAKKKPAVKKAAAKKTVEKEKSEEKTEKKESAEE